MTPRTSPHLSSSYRTIALICPTWHFRVNRNVTCMLLTSFGAPNRLICMILWPFTCRDSQRLCRGIVLMMSGCTILIPTLCLKLRIDNLIFKHHLQFCSVFDTSWMIFVLIFVRLDSLVCFFLDLAALWNVQTCIACWLVEGWMNPASTTKTFFLLQMSSQRWEQLLLFWPHPYTPCRPHFCLLNSSCLFFRFTTAQICCSGNIWSIISYCRLRCNNYWRRLLFLRMILVF